MIIKNGSGMKAASRFPLKSCQVAKVTKPIVNRVVKIARGFFMV
jgi:hypothetical protein